MNRERISALTLNGLIPSSRESWNFAQQAGSIHAWFTIAIFTYTSKVLKTYIERCSG
jgi:hypothetical protein